MVRLLLFLGLFFSGFLTSSASAQVYIHPGGSSVQSGGYVNVDNWTKGSVAVQITLDDGTPLLETILGPMGWGDWPVPVSKELIGRKITVTVTEMNGNVTTKTYVITASSDGSAQSPADAPRARTNLLRA